MKQNFVNHYLDTETTGLFWNYLNTAKKPGIVQLSTYKEGSKTIDDLWTDIGLKHINEYFSSNAPTRPGSKEAILLEDLMTMDQPWQDGILSIQSSNVPKNIVGSENVLAGVLKSQLSLAEKAHAQMNGLIDPITGQAKVHSSSRDVVFAKQATNQAHQEVFTTATRFGVSTEKALEHVKNILDSTENGKKSRLMGWNLGFDIDALKTEAGRIGRTDIIDTINQAKAEGRIADMGQMFQSLMYTKASQHTKDGRFSLYHSRKDMTGLSLAQLDKQRADILENIKSGTNFVAPTLGPGAQDPRILELHPGFATWMKKLEDANDPLRGDYGHFLQYVADQTANGDPANMTYRGMHFQSFKSGAKNPEARYVGLWSLETIASALGISDRFTKDADVGIRGKNILSQQHDAAYDNLLVAKLSNIIDQSFQSHENDAIKRLEMFNQLIEKDYGVTQEQFWDRLQHFGELKAIEKQRERLIQKTTKAAGGLTLDVASQQLHNIFSAGKNQMAAAPAAAITSMAQQSVPLAQAANAASVPLAKSIGQHFADFLKTTHGKVAAAFVGLSALAPFVEESRRPEAQVTDPHLTTAQIAALPDTVRGTYLHATLQAELLRTGQARSVETEIQTYLGKGFMDAVAPDGTPIEIKTHGSLWSPVPEHVKQLQKYMLAMKQARGRLQYIDYKSGPGVIKEFAVGLPSLRASENQYQNYLGINPSEMQDRYASDFGSGRNWIVQLARSIHIHNQKESIHAGIDLLSTLSGVSRTLMSEDHLLSNAKYRVHSGMLDAIREGSRKVVSGVDPLIGRGLINFRGIPKTVSARSLATSSPVDMTLSLKIPLAEELGGIVADTMLHKNPIGDTRGIPILTLGDPGMSQARPVMFNGRLFDQVGERSLTGLGISNNTASVAKLSALTPSYTSQLSRHSKFDRIGSPYAFAGSWRGADQTKNVPELTTFIPRGVQGPWNTQLHGIRRGQFSNKFPFGSQANEQENVTHFSDWINRVMFGAVAAGSIYGGMEQRGNFMASVSAEIGTNSWTSTPMHHHLDDIYEFIQLKYRMHPVKAREVLASLGFDEAYITQHNIQLRDFLPTNAKPYPGPAPSSLSMFEKVKHWWTSRAARRDALKEFQSYANTAPAINLSMGGTATFSTKYGAAYRRTAERLMWASGGPGKLGVTARLANLFGAGMFGYGFDMEANAAEQFKDVAEHYMSKQGPSSHFIHGPNVYDYTGSTKTLFGSTKLADIKNNNIAGYFARKSGEFQQLANTIKLNDPNMYMKDPKYLHYTKMANINRSVAGNVRRVGAGGIAMAGLLALPTYVSEVQERATRLGGSIGAYIGSTVTSAFTVIGGAVGGILGTFIPGSALITGAIGGTIGSMVGSFVGDILEGLASGLYNKPSMDRFSRYETADSTNSYEQYYRDNLKEIPGTGRALDIQNATSAINGSGLNQAEFGSPWRGNSALSSPILRQARLPRVAVPQVPLKIPNMHSLASRHAIRDQRTKLGLSSHFNPSHYNKTRRMTAPDM